MGMYDDNCQIWVLWVRSQSKDNCFWLGAITAGQGMYLKSRQQCSVLAIPEANCSVTCA